MTYCHVSREISDYLDHIDEMEMAEQYEESIKDRVKADIMNSLTNHDPVQMSEFLSVAYDFDLKEWLTDNLDRDGVYEYFIERKNPYYRNAIRSILDDIDFTSEIEHQKQIDEEYSLGI